MLWKRFENFFGLEIDNLNGEKIVNTHSKYWYSDLCLLLRESVYRIYNI